MANMNGHVLHLAQRLQSKLENIDDQQDRDTLVWAHGFLTGIINNIQSRLPEIMTYRTLLERTQAALEAAQTLGQSSGFADLDDDDSLDRVERELGEADDAPVPAKRKPGPKGLRGGAAVRPPESDLPM